MVESFFNSVEPIRKCINRNFDIFFLSLFKKKSLITIDSTCKQEVRKKRREDSFNHDHFIEIYAYHQRWVAIIETTRVGSEEVEGGACFCDFKPLFHVC